MEECESSESRTRFVSSIDAEKRDLKYNRVPKMPIKCKFCGKELYDQGVIFPGGERILAWLGHETCTCQPAQEEKIRRDRKKRQEEEIKRQEEELRARQKKIERIFNNSGIGQRFKNRTFDNFEVDRGNQASFRNAKTYADNFDKFKDTGEGIYFSGGNGTGKTHLAVAIALELIEKGVPVICMTSIKLLQEIRRTYDRNRNVSEYQILEAYKEVDLLVIDDLGQENITDWSLAMLYDIINDRYERCLPTIVTTNLNDQELIRAWSLRTNDWTAKAIVSRLHEMTMGITVTGRDRRKDKRY